MNKMAMRLTELMRELFMAEGILKDWRGIHMIVNSSKSFSQKKKNIIEFSKQKRKFRGKGKKKKSKVLLKCLLCDLKGH